MSVHKSPIPIKNIFYMLCYAWNILAIKDDIKVGEDDFDDAYNLLGRIFTYGIGKLIRAGFHRSYISQGEDLSTLRGKINMQESVTKFSSLHKKLYCNYDDYSTNDVFNQILKFTIERLLRNPNISAITKTNLKKQRMFFVGIDETAPTKENRKKLVFNRNNVIYQMLIRVAIMLYDNTIVNDEDGSNVFKDFFRDGQMEKVYEQFILNFYAVNLDPKIYKVHAPKINWKMEKDAEFRFGDLVDIIENPSDRRSDIVVENKVTQKQLIIDAKYYQETLVQGYRDSTIERFRRNHIDQVRGYVIDSEFIGKKLGALIYPTVRHDFKRPRMAPLIQAPIFFKTLNLNDEWRKIEEDLVLFIDTLEIVLDRM
ncbi:MAG: hypothetical protein IKC52_06590 [Clostridia bacterium]|nr:hypothetical protein [Clostridia bacterium]